MTFFSAPPREKARRPHQSSERLLTFQVPGLSRLIAHFRSLRDAKNRQTVEAAWDAAHDPRKASYDRWIAAKAWLEDAQRRNDTRDAHYWTQAVKRAQQARLELGA